MDIKNTFFKSDLRDGMIVELVNEQIYRVNGDVLESNSHGELSLGCYSDTLKYGIHKDIIQLERPEIFNGRDIRSIYTIDYNDSTRQYDYNLIYQFD